MDLKEIQRKGITKIRLEKWINPDAHIVLFRDERGYGPWTTLVDDWGKKALGEAEFKKVEKMLIWKAVIGDDWVEYKGKN